MLFYVVDVRLDTSDIGDCLSEGVGLNLLLSCSSLLDIGEEVVGKIVLGEEKEEGTEGEGMIKVNKGMHAQGRNGIPAEQLDLVLVTRIKQAPTQTPAFRLPISFSRLNSSLATPLGHSTRS